jgi:hypothetical protein
VVDPVVARKTWRTLEPYHGLVYFAPEATDAYAVLGIQGFDGYFASRGNRPRSTSASVLLRGGWATSPLGPRRWARRRPRP